MCKSPLKEREEAGAACRMGKLRCEAVALLGTASQLPHTPPQNLSLRPCLAQKAISNRPVITHISREKIVNIL